jgi:hypothetical protein
MRLGKNCSQSSCRIVANKKTTFQRDSFSIQLLIIISFENIIYLEHPPFPSIPRFRKKIELHYPHNYHHRHHIHQHDPP